MGFPVLPLVCIEWRTIVFVGFLLGSVLFLENHIAPLLKRKKALKMFEEIYSGLLAIKDLCFACRGQLADYYETW